MTEYVDGFLIVEGGQYTPKAEAETILTYDAGIEEWYIFTDYAPHARKWEDKVIAQREGTPRAVSRKEYDSEGRLVAISGIIDGSVAVRMAVQLTKEERKERAERLKKANKEG